MTGRKHTRKGFTLVEILIVVVILGILAAIVIPQFTSASETAKQSSLETQLQTVRSQLELYQVQHNGNYPTLAQMWGNLTAQTDVNGGTGTAYGPYLQKAPVNPFTAGADGAALAANGSAAATKGWTYNATTGEIRASLSTAQAGNLTLETTDVEEY